MNIFEAPPEQLERWFHESDRQHVTMCLLLAPRQEDRTLFEHLISEVVEMDSALGLEISFMLFRQPNAKSLERAANGQGQVSRVIDDLYTIGNEESHDSRNVRNLVTRSSQKVIPELCRQFDVAFDQLPAMIVLGKGVREPYVFSLSSQADYDEILTFMRQLADILKDSQAVIRSEMQMRRDIEMIRQTSAAIEARWHKIEYAANGLAKKHRLPNAPLAARGQSRTH